MKKLLIIITCSVLFAGCFPELFGKRDGKFLKEVIRLDEFNSEYDDYNSNIAQNKAGEIRFTFSSRRAKKDYFNLVYFTAELAYGKRLGINIVKNGDASFRRYEETYGEKYGLTSKANGNFNVLGPKTVDLMNDFPQYGNITDELLLFYADDSKGDLEIKYVRKLGPLVEDPVNFDLLNSPKDDAYPTFSSDGSKIYFCSNREGNFDIYEVTIPRTNSESVSLESLVKPNVFEIRKVEELSTPYDDKCPYFNRDKMVFVSDRPGGRGGNDIYYSTLENGKWTSPVNAGDRINTSFNEYRPILPDLPGFNYDLMLFSSDRPGGKGGYDLYMTGLADKY